MERHRDFDEARWVEADGYEGRLLLGYNPHTFPGRIGVWSDALGHGTRISAYEVTDASDSARAWIDGYLAGNQPPPERMFGYGIRGLPDDDSKWQRWREAVNDFRESGNWSVESWGDVTPIDPEAELPCPAWRWRGDEVWSWTGSDWVAADHQPWRDGGESPDELCNDSHSMAMIDNRHSQCERCGITSEVEPI